MAREVLQDQGEGSAKYKNQSRCVLPANNPKGRRVWKSGGEDSRAMPCRIRPLTHNMEMKVIISLIEELRSKMALDLDTAPSFDRTMGSQTRPKKKSDYLMVGCCNSKQISEILRSRGIVTCAVFSKDWRINRTSVNSMANAIRKQIEDEDPTVVYLELLDNSVYYCKQEDGSRIVPKKGEDEIYDIEGELQVCARDVQAVQFTLLRPVFEAVEDRKIIWSVPTPRYITGSCCDDPSHMINKDDQYLRENIAIQLDALKKNMRDFTYYSNKKMKVFDPNQEIKGMGKDEIWTDSVTVMSPEAATRVVDGLVRLVESMNAPRDDRNTNNPNRRENIQQQSQGWRGRGSRGQHGGWGGNSSSSRGGTSDRGRLHDPEQAMAAGAQEAATETSGPGPTSDMLASNLYFVLFFFCSHKAHVYIFKGCR
jgi:hypothetical protein